MAEAGVSAVPAGVLHLPKIEDLAQTLRFAPERAEHERHSHSWVPFGGGPHMCLGFRFAELQVRSLMHQMLRRYRWSVPAGYTMPVQQAPISKPRDGSHSKPH